MENRHPCIKIDYLTSDQRTPTLASSIGVVVAGPGTSGAGIVGLPGPVKSIRPAPILLIATQAGIFKVARACHMPAWVACTQQQPEWKRDK